MNAEYLSRLNQLFFGYALSRQAEARKAAQRFVYYTRADTAIKLFKNEELWLRSVAVMNDASEIRYGMGLMMSALRRFARERLLRVIEPLHSGVVDDALGKLEGSAAALFNATYICCFSEHLGGREDRFGRLSMWRAYGASSGTALVFHGNALLSDSNAFGAYSSPVVYVEQHDFDVLLNEFLDRLDANTELIKGCLPGPLVRILWDMLRFAVLSTKHPAFEEEREWRVIYAPWEESSTRIKLATETVAGIPQIVYKLPLKNVPEDGFMGAETSDGLDRIIIGPCHHPREIAHALAQTLADKGLKDPYSRITISYVPLRVPNV